MISLRDAVEKWNDLDKSSRLKVGYTVILLLAVGIGWSMLDEQVAKLERKRLAREQTLKELMPLKATYFASKASHDQLSSRLSAVRQDDTPARILEEAGIGIKGLKVTPLKSEERNGIIEEAADVRIDGLTANEVINLFYRLEKGGRPVLVRKANIRVRFDDPSRFDLLLTTVLMKQPAVKPK
jgi:general secretion pathway protein M